MTIASNLSFVQNSAGAITTGTFNSGAGPITFSIGGTEYNRVDGNGYSLFGYTTSQGSYKLQVNGNIYASGNIVGNITGNVTGVVSTASNLAGGVAGQLVYQVSPGISGFINTSSVTVGTATNATNLLGGAAGSIHYQSAANTTAMLALGSVNSVLTAGASAPAYVSQVLAGNGTASSTQATGQSLVVTAGGLGVTGDSYFAGSVGVGTNLTVTGNLTVQGTTTQVNSTITNVSDPIITIGGGTNGAAPTSDDSKDRGIAFQWFDSSPAIAKTGFFGFDRSTKYFTFLTSATLTTEITAPNGGTTKGALDAYLAGGTAQSIVYQSAADTTSYLAAGTAGFVLQTNGTGSAPSWVPIGALSAGTATSVLTVQQTASATYYPVMVSANNVTGTAMSEYTTSSFTFNPATGFHGIGSAPDSTYRLGVANTIKVGTQGGTDVTLIGGGSGTGSYIKGYYGTDGSQAFNILGNGSTYFNASSAGGSFAIGTSTNAAFFVVQQGLPLAGSGPRGGGNTKFFFSGNGTTAGSNYMELQSPATSTADILFSSSATSPYGIVRYDNTNGSMSFWTSSTQYVTINSVGSLGFGATPSYGTSGYVLQSNGTAGNPTWVAPSTITSGNATNAANIATVAQPLSGTYYPTFVIANNASSSNMAVYTTSSFTVNPATRTVNIGNSAPQGAPSATDITANATLLLSGTGGNYLGFGQYPSGQNYAQWIQSAYQNPTTAAYNLVLQPLGGSVLINATALYSGEKFAVNGGAYVNGNFTSTNAQITSLGVGTIPSGTAGEIRATNEITAYYSDRRLKENVKFIDNAVTKVLSLNGITYTPNDVAASYGYDKTIKLVGLFADEVEAVLPEATRPAPFDDDGKGGSRSGENYRTIQYEKLVPLLIEAIKEQQQQIAQLQDQVNSLVNK